MIVAGVVCVLVLYFLLKISSSPKLLDQFFGDGFPKVISRLTSQSPGSGPHVELLEKQHVEDQFDATRWQRRSYDAFRAAVTSIDPVAFPCIYATKGFKANEHRYVFLESDDMKDKQNVEPLAVALRQYLATPKTELGPNTSLVALFPIPNPDQVSTVEEYHKKYWDCLYSLRQADVSPWPQEIPKQTDAQLWRLCFDGHQIFSAALTPAHKKRRSRYAPCFGIVFQPKFVFDILFATEVKKQGAIAKVRGLLTEYDSVPISPELKNYGDVNGRESKQYFLMDENYSLSCPYTSLE